MRGDLVALDLETTGLDIQRDHIIEVGIARLRDGEIIDEFSTLVNPPIPIPAMTTHITGIRQEDVVYAPRIESILPKISAFIGNAPVIAHNIALDMGMMQDRYGLLSDNLKLDTYDIASVLLPDAPRYNLNSLTTQAGIVLDNAHRALADAKAAGLLYWYLWEKLINLPRSVIQQIVTLSDDIAWDATPVFRAALDFAQDKPIMPPSSARSAMTRTTGDSAPTHHPINLAAIDALIGAQGRLQSEIPLFQHRSQQVTMAHAISQAFNNGDHVMIEAGTGTGKSLAYLIPAILWATQNNQRVVISTNTINLQDQLINADIPMLQNTLGVEFRASVMKGRSNYLSPQRLKAALRRRPTSVVELRTLAKILVWQLENQSGDRSQISLRGSGEYGVWNLVSAEETDSGDSCADDPTSPFCRARQSAEQADIVIVNHALLIADAKADHRVLPDYDYLIVDEAHQLEDAITNGTSRRMDRGSLTRGFAFLGNAGRGLLKDVLDTVSEHTSHKDILRLEAFIQSVNDVVLDMEAHIQKLFQHFTAFMDDVRGSRSPEFLTLVRMDRSYRNRSTFAEAQSTWQTLVEYVEAIQDALQRLARFLHKLDTNHQLDEAIASIQATSEAIQQDTQLLQGFLIQPEETVIYWMSMAQGNDAPTLHSAPLSVADLMRRHLWSRKKSVILTSATLRTQNEFSFIQQRLGAEDVATLDVGSPFNYKDSTLIYIPKDVPEPTEKRGYQQAVEKAIIEIAAALEGRVMVLFTSYTQLRQTSQAVTPRLALGHINVYDQSDGTSRQSLLDGFKSDEHAVLLGTKSFWEGVDIPGDSLSALIITRLPFAVPTDPVFSARAEMYPDPFHDYNLPDAVLAFRQGFGRLIRRSTDRGIVVILDARVRTKSYGAAFLNALPECTIKDGRLDELANAAKNWLTIEP